MRMRMMASRRSSTSWRSARSTRGYSPCDALMAGDVGYIGASIKDVADTRVGDTITDAANPADAAAARLPQGDPDGVLRHLPRRRRGLRRR